MNALVKTSPQGIDRAETAPPAVPEHSGASLYRVSTDAAALCREIVLATSVNIQGRRYVNVEGWMAVALAHGCAASSGDVVRHEDGSVSATGRVIRIDTGRLISSAEGYVGADEQTWFGGKNAYGKMLPKRPDYAIRAMAQTRAISRACRSAFAHVVVMMNAGLSTTPAEEMPDEGERSPSAASAAVPAKKPFKGATIEPDTGAAIDDAIPERATGKPERTRRMVLDELALNLAVAQTEADIHLIENSADVKKAYATFKNGLRDELDALMGAAWKRVQGEDAPPGPDPGAADDVFPGDLK